jgi:hypothetical protein
MAHLLAGRIIQSVDKVHSMVEEGGLGNGGRNDGNLGQQSAHSSTVGQLVLPTVSLSTRRIFILADAEPAEAASPTVTIRERYPDTAATTSMAIERALLRLVMSEARSSSSSDDATVE